MEQFENQKVIFSFMGFQIWSSVNSKVRFINQVKKPSLYRDNQNITSKPIFSVDYFKQNRANNLNNGSNRQTQDDLYKSILLGQNSQYQKKGNIDFKKMKQRLCKNLSSTQLKTRASTNLDQEPNYWNSKIKKTEKYIYNPIATDPRRYKIDGDNQKSSLTMSRSNSKISLKGYSGKSSIIKPNKKLYSQQINPKQQYNIFRGGFQGLAGAKQVFTLQDDQKSQNQSRLEFPLKRSRRTISNLASLYVSQNCRT